MASLKRKHKEENEMSAYYTVGESRIVELRHVADNLKNVQELQALCMLYGLRSMQECDEDMLKDGEYEVNCLPNKQDCEDRAASFLEDTICVEELNEIAKQNDLGDYSLSIVPVVTVSRKI